jgi:hypothetical protein
MKNTDEEIRPAADEEFETLAEKEIKPFVTPAVYTRLLEAANAVARAHYGRGFMHGGSEPLVY